MRMLQLGLVSCLILFLTSSLVPAAKDADAKEEDAKALIVGKWEPAAANRKAMIEFTKEGKIKITNKETEKEITRDGSYEFTGEDNKSIKMSFKDPETGMEMTH